MHTRNAFAIAFVLLAGCGNMPLEITSDQPTPDAGNMALDAGNVDGTLPADMIADTAETHKSVPVIGCLAGGKFPPQACKVTGADPQTKSPWVVCRADCKTAWISSTKTDDIETQFYHAFEICKDLGYDDVVDWGGNGGFECGYWNPFSPHSDSLANPTSCENPGTEWFDGAGTWEEACQPDQYGIVICYIVAWKCARSTKPSAASPAPPG